MGETTQATAEPNYRLAALAINRLADELQRAFETAKAAHQQAALNEARARERKHELADLVNGAATLQSRLAYAADRQDRRHDAPAGDDDDKDQPF